MKKINTEEYKKGHNKEVASFKLNIDIIKSDIKKTYFYKSNCYIIFLDKNGEIRILYTPDLEEYINKIFIDMTLLENENYNYAIADEVFRNLKARIYKMALEKREKEAKEIIKESRQEIKKIKTSRSYFFLFYLVAIICCLYLLFSFDHNKILIQNNLEKNNLLRTLIVAGTGGIIGGMLSQPNLRYFSDSKFNIIIMSLRYIFISMISGILIYFVIDLNIALGFITQNFGNYGIFIFAVIAGYYDKILISCFEKIKDQLLSKR